MGAEHSIINDSTLLDNEITEEELDDEHMEQVNKIIERW